MRTIGILLEKRLGRPTPTASDSARNLLNMPRFRDCRFDSRLGHVLSMKAVELGVLAKLLCQSAGE